MWWTVLHALLYVAPSHNSKMDAKRMIYTYFLRFNARTTSKSPIAYSHCIIIVISRSQLMNWWKNCFVVHRHGAWRRILGHSTGNVAPGEAGCGFHKHPPRPHHPLSLRSLLHSSAARRTGVHHRKHMAGTHCTLSRLVYSMQKVKYLTWLPFWSSTLWCHSVTNYDLPVTHYWNHTFNTIHPTARDLWLRPTTTRQWCRCWEAQLLWSQLFSSATYWTTSWDDTCGSVSRPSLSGLFRISSSQSKRL